MLCNSCQATVEELWPLRFDGDEIPEPYKIFGGWRHCRTKVVHHDSRQNLIKSSQDACYICHRLRLKVDQYDLSYNGDKDLFEICRPFTFACWTDPSEYAVYRLEFYLSPNLQMEHMEEYLKLGTFDLHTSNGLGPIGMADSNTTDISACGKIVRHWLTTCNDSHPRCSQKRESDWYPTRLLDLQNVNMDGYIKLINTKQHRPDGPYATLSHCWGGAIRVKLTSSTLVQSSLRIFIRDLPRTFVDAITTALFLGLQYIWIDALTIIQDSDEDWAKEAALMADVYHNAYINIGATASSNSDGGLFFERDPNLVNPQRYRIAEEDYLLISNDQLQSSLREAPLIRRGWVMQERKLCRRMLHFGAEQLLWECSGMRRCEATPDSEPHNIWNKASSYDSVSKPIWAQWVNDIVNYATSDLTFESDKLVAISGIARFLHRIVKDDYTAGLWKTDFVFQLAWMALAISRDSRTIKTKKTVQYIAPSWSWASIRCDLQYPFLTDRLRVLAQLVDYKLEYKSPDTFGQLVGGFITMLAPLHEIHMSNEYVSSLQRHRCQMLVKGLGCKFKPQVYMDIVDHRSQWADTLFGLPLFFGWRSTREPPDPGDLTVLLLRREAGTDLRFSRVGVSTIENDTAAHMLATVKKVESLPDEIFDPDRGYTIKII